MARRMRMLVLCALVSTRALAQTGVSDDRVSLPDGPGSVEGLGDNASVAGNMGLSSYEVPFEVPEGYAGATPSIGLSYGSGAGSGIAGVGWTMRVPSIERTTLRGLPVYGADDEFAADGSEQLVRVSTGVTPTYRARFEGAFVRYTWVGPGEAGYWKAEYPDGSVGYFGATSTGTLVPTARLAAASGATFRYHLVERVDVHGHRIRYEYELVDGSPYLVRIGYVHGDDGSPHHVVSFAYALRPDVISDAKPGFEERTTRRLVGVSVSVGGEVIRRYALSYEAGADAPGVSRLASVETFGRNGSRYPVVFTFRYSRALGVRCVGCERPYLVSMGAPLGAAAFRNGGATLVDLDGDSLPDLVDTSAVGFHRIHRNRLVSPGRSTFGPAETSAVGRRDGFDVTSAQVQAMDVDGDGLTDLANIPARAVLCNRGTGDWSTTGCSFGTDFDLPLEDDPSDPSDPNPFRTRFVDIDNDRRIDVLRTDLGGSTIVRRNTEAGFVSASVEPIGLVFDADRVELADLNGDGLLDPIVIADDGSITRRIHLGRGRWTDWTAMPAPALAQSELGIARFEDLNGDGLDDLVLVLFDTIRYALNRGGSSFAPFETIGAADVEGGIAERSATTTVLFADMNASGSVDVVWVDADGTFRFLELFPEPPHLLTRIENGLGAVQTIDYGTAIGERARDGGAGWLHPMTVPTNVVERIDVWTELTGADGGVGRHDVTTYRYSGGFYDGRERQSRGFERVETITPAEDVDDSQEAGRVVVRYDVGADDPYFAGRRLVETAYAGAGGAERLLHEVRFEHDDVALADVPTSGLRFAVRFVADVGRSTIVAEGAARAEWVTIRSTTLFDGYGQVLRDSQLGVTNLGAPEAPTACPACVSGAESFGAPCGASCRGDEYVTETTYVEPGPATGGTWILGRPAIVRHYGDASGLRDETRFHYDGDPFVGLPSGTLTRGNVSRVLAKREATSGAMVAIVRSAHDAHGNEVARLDAAGSPDDDGEHRASFAYDARGLRRVRTDLHLRSTEGSPYRLRREFAYDAAFGELIEATDYMVVEGTTIRSARNATIHRLDEFGRRIARIEPGDSIAAPTAEYVWDLGSRSSRVIERQRTIAGGAAELERVLCLDGRGRVYQELVRIDGDRYQASGFAEYDGRGAPVRVYQPYLHTGNVCDLAPPESALHEDVVYDVRHREILRTRSDGSARGTASTTSRSYAPLALVISDENDTDPSHPATRTPEIRRFDGLGRVTSVERRLETDVVGPTTWVEYDGLGRVSALVDPAGHRKEQRHDLLGRILLVDDPSSGATSFEYDDVGNRIGRVDARGVEIRTRYDGANRLLARWDPVDPEGTTVELRYDFGGDCPARDCTHGAGRVIEVRYPLEATLADRMGSATGTDRFGFDARARAVFVSRSLGDVVLVTHRIFDGAGRRTTTVHPDGRRIEVEFDGASRVTSIEGVIDDLIYDDRGAPRSIEYANGVVEAFERDDRAEVVRRTFVDGSGTPFEDVSYVRDRAGDLVSAVDTVETQSALGRLDASYAHDGWNRLVAATHRDEDSTETHRSWALDALDRVLASTATDPSGADEELDYDAIRPHAVVSVAGTQYGYDEAGELVTRGDVTFAWDHLGRLVRATRADATLATFSYGLGDDAVASVSGSAVTLYAADDFEVRDGIAVAYVRIGRRRVARLESSTIAASILPDRAPAAGDGNIDAADAFAAHLAADADPRREEARACLRSAARRMLIEAGDGTAALHADELGNLVAATDANGAVRGRRRFEPFSPADTRTGFVDRYGVTGQEEFAELGLVRFRHRWLDVRSRRWTQPDPAFLSIDAVVPERIGETTSRYAYVGNDPIDRFDPTGLWYARGAGNGGARRQMGRDLADHATAGVALLAIGQHVPPAPANTTAAERTAQRSAQGQSGRSSNLRQNEIAAQNQGIHAVYGVGNGFQAHHVLPWAVMGAQAHRNLMARGARGGFDGDGIENAIALRADQHRGHHPEYNELVDAALTQLAHNLANATDAEVGVALRMLASELRQRIIDHVGAGQRLSMRDGRRRDPLERSPFRGAPRPFLPFTTPVNDALRRGVAPA